MTLIDIGGGMPVDYASDAPDEERPERVTMTRYAAALREEVPELFANDGRYSIVTEFGRHLSAKCGLMISTIECVLAASAPQLAPPPFIHAAVPLTL